MSEGKWFNNIARLIKHNGKFFVSFERAKRKNKETGEYEYHGESPYPITINEGDTFQAKLKKDDLAKLVLDKKMTQETANEICERVKFEFSIPPRDPKTQSGTKPSSNKKKEEVDF